MVEIKLKNIHKLKHICTRKVVFFIDYRPNCLKTKLLCSFPRRKCCVDLSIAGTTRVWNFRRSWPRLHQPKPTAKSRYREGTPYKNIYILLLFLLFVCFLFTFCSYYSIIVVIYCLMKKSWKLQKGTEKRFFQGFFPSLCYMYYEKYSVHKSNTEIKHLWKNVSKICICVIKSNEIYK